MINAALNPTWYLAPSAGQIFKPLRAVTGPLAPLAKTAAAPIAPIYAVEVAAGKVLALPFRGANRLAGIRNKANVKVTAQIDDILTRAQRGEIITQAEIKGVRRVDDELGYYLELVLDDMTKREIPITTKPSLGISKEVDEIASRIAFAEDKIVEPKIPFAKKLERLFTMGFDENYPLRNFMKVAERVGIDVPFEEVPYNMRRLMLGSHGKANEFLTYKTFGRKVWELNEKGKAKFAPRGKGLKELMKRVDDDDLLKLFKTYTVAKSQIGRKFSQRGIKTGITDKQAIKAIADLEIRYPWFKDVANDLFQYQDDVLRYVKESGALSPQMYKKFKQANEDYVPFYRVYEELANRGYFGKGSANLRSFFKPIKGDEERLIIDPLQSVVKNTYVLLHMADANMANLAMANVANKHPLMRALMKPIKTPIAKVATVTGKELGIDIAGITAKETDDIINIFRPAMFSKEPNTLTVLVKGKPKYFKLEHELYKAVLGLDPPELGKIWKILGYPAKWLRAGAILSPDFWLIKNPFRDIESAFVYSRYGFIPPVDFARGLFEMVNRGEMYHLWAASGGQRAMLTSLDREYLSKSLKEVLRGKGFKDYIKHPLDTLELAAELTEQATRLGEFKAAIRKGATPEAAAFASREVTLDFAVIGSQTKAFNLLTAFWNANMRAQEKLWRELIQRPERIIPKAIMGITLPSILLYQANREDARWKSLPQWQKDLFWIIIPKRISEAQWDDMSEEERNQFNRENKIYRVPKPFELGILFGTMPERIMEYIDNQDPEVFKDMVRNALESASPGFLPTAAIPILENITNYSFFLDRPIVPESRKDLPPELQYHHYSSEVAKKLGDWVNYSPAMIENLLRGYTAGLGKYADEALELILKETGVVPNIPEPSKDLIDIPIIKAAVVRNPFGSADAHVQKFYEKLEEYQGGEKFLKEMGNAGRMDKFNEFRDDHPELQITFDWETGEVYSPTARWLKQQAKKISEIRQIQYEIYEDEVMTSEAKRDAINEIDRQISDYAQIALQNLENMPDEIMMDLSPDVGEEAKVESFPLYRYLQVIPSDMREYVRTHAAEWNRRNLRADREVMQMLKNQDAILIKQYEDIPAKQKGDDVDLRLEARKNDPNLDMILHFWGRTDTFKSLEARDLIRQRLNAIDLPEEILPFFTRDWEEVIEFAPKYLSDYMDSHENEFPPQQVDRIWQMKTDDVGLLQQYDEAFEEQEFANDREEDLARLKFRKDNPEVDAALAIWRGLIIKSRQAKDILDSKINILGIPQELVPYYTPKRITRKRKVRSLIADNPILQALQ